MYGKNIYKGHRYVPLIVGVWDKNKEYEGLTVVIWRGNSYTSKRYVPVGVDINNETYWVMTGNYNAQIEQYRKEVRSKQDKNDCSLETVSKTIVGAINENRNNIIEANKTINTAFNTIDNTINYLPSSGVSSKLLYKLGGHTFIVTKKPNLDGYVRFRMRDDIVDNSSASVGGSGQLLRSVEVLNVTETKVMNFTESSNDGSWTTGQANYGSVLVDFRNNTGGTPTGGDYIEYNVFVPYGHTGIECMLYGSNGSSDDVSIMLDGSIIKTISFKKPSGQFFSTFVSCNYGTHTIRFQTNKPAYIGVAGVGVVDLENYKRGMVADKAIVVYQGTSNQYITNGGAIDYAMFSSEKDKWCGSYHGGETREMLKIVVDNKTIDLQNGMYIVGDLIEIEQRTNIIEQLKAYSRYLFRNDGVQEFEVVFTGEMMVTQFITNMTTTHSDYTEVRYPIVADTINVGTNYMPLGANYVIQRNPNNNQKIITVMNNNMITPTQNQAYIQSSQYYNKVYKENVNTKIPVKFSGGNFKSVHVFE